MNRTQIADKWTNKENYPYNYVIVFIDGVIARIFNSHRHSISPTSEVFEHFKSKYHEQTQS